MPKIVCVKCEIEYKPEKTGGYVIEMFSNPPEPYKIWQADFWKCPECDNIIVSGFGLNAIAEHFEDNFKEVLERVKEETVFVVHDYEKKEATNGKTEQVEKSD